MKKINVHNNTTRDVYAVPSMKVNVTKQIEIVKDAIKGLKIGHTWVQVENPTTWNSDHRTNHAFLKSLVDGFGKHGHRTGIQTNEQSWQRIMGRSHSEFGRNPLWYVHHDGRPDLEHFRPFGGWRTAQAKQYKAGEELCGDTVNLDTFFA